MNKFFNWLFGFNKIKPESKEDQEKREAEINSCLDNLQRINRELKHNKEEMEAIDQYLNPRPPR